MPACLEALVSEGVHVAVDTCGFAARAAVEAVARASDLLLWDIKNLDGVRHQQLTGAPLQPILDNLTAVLDPIRQRYADLAARRAEIRDILDRNAAHCREVSGRTILEVKEKMGLTPVWKV